MLSGYEHIITFRPRATFWYDYFDDINTIILILLCGHPFAVALAHCYQYKYFDVIVIVTLLILLLALDL